MSRSSSHNHVKKDTEDVVKQTTSSKQRYRSKPETYSGQTEPTDKRARDGSHPNKDSRSSEKESSHIEDKGTGRKDDYCSHKIQKSTIARAKSASQEIVDKRHSSSDSKKEGSLERRPDKAKMVISDCENEHKKLKSRHKPERHSNLKDKNISSSRQHIESSGSFHKERNRSREKDYQSKEDRRHKDDTKRRHDRSNLSETTKKHDGLKPKELHKKGLDSSGRKRLERTHDAVKTLPEKRDVDGTSSANVKNPNKKLCFMETLNLTLSPNKKPLHPKDGSPHELTSVKVDVENGQTEEDSQINIEDMCIIDEAENSELETDSKDVTDLSPDDLKASSPERIHERVDDVIKVQEKAIVLSEMADNEVQTTLTPCQSSVTESRMTEHLTSKSTDNSSFKAKDNLTHNEDKIELVSNSHVTEPGTSHVLNKPHSSNMSGIVFDHLPNSTLQNIHSKDAKEHTVADSEEIPVPLKISQNTTVEVAVSSDPEDLNVFEGKAEKISLRSSHSCQQDLCPPSTSITHEKDGHGLQDCTKGVDFVSSTISPDSFPQEEMSLTEAIYVLTQTNVDTSESSSATTQPSSSTDCIGVSKVSSTTEEEPLLEKYCTPKKSFIPSKIQGTNTKMSSSVPLLHDEDSMMRTLNSLKKIPDAISPLRSPVRITKQSLVHVQNKPGHVKSLQKGRI